MAFIQKADKGLFNPEVTEGLPPSMKFQYQFKSPFMSVAEGFMKKHSWEPRTHITSVSEVSQPDDDHFVFYRRKEDCLNAAHVWERCVINRAEKSIRSETLGANHDGSSYVIERTMISPEGDSAANMTTDVFDMQGASSGKVEVFKSQCLKIIKAMQFSKWEAESN